MRIARDAERARDEGMPLSDAIGLVTDAVVSAGARGVPLVGMKLDYDLTILEMQARLLWGTGFLERGWRGPLLDAVVRVRLHVDRAAARHVDPPAGECGGSAVMALTLA